MEIDPTDSFSELGFTIGRCEPCGRSVLTYPGDDPDDTAVYCVHCGGPVTGELRDAVGADLPDHGYGLLELQGCGNPDCGGGACSRMADESAE